jgi:predicted  nucleic acid-binding Zn-ribbon protein
MAVKTNHEYHAMQSQIAAQTTEVGRIEEQMLINMVEADEVAARVKTAEAALKAEETVIAKERKAIEVDTTEMERVVAASDGERRQVLTDIPRATIETFERVFKARQGLAVAPAVDGHCSICHVRLRPQVYNMIRRNDSIIQCDSCQRILYFTGVHERSAAGQAAANAPGQQHADPTAT